MFSLPRDQINTFPFYDGVAAQNKSETEIYSRAHDAERL